MPTSKILSTPIGRLPAGDRFKRISEAMGLSTLQHVIDMSPEDLQTNKCFDYLWFNELINILEENGLIHLLQTKQGSSRV